MNTTQSEHAQTEAMYAAAMEFAAEKASISYVQRKCRCSYNDAERMLERMVSEGIIETYGGRKTVATTPSQPAAPQGGAEAPKVYLSVNQLLQAIEFATGGAPANADELETSIGFQIGHSQDDDGKVIHGMRCWLADYPEEGVYPLDEEPTAKDLAAHALRASHGQAPAGATEREFKQFLSDVMTAAGLVTHGNKCKALGDRLAEMCMRLRCPTAQAAPAAGAVAGPTSMPPSAFLNAAGIKADDMPGTVVRKLDAAFHEAVTFADAAPTPAAQADSQPEPPTEYPALPEPSATGLGDEYEAYDRTGRAMGKAYETILYFKADQMRAYVDADRQARKQGGGT